MAEEAEADEAHRADEGDRSGTGEAGGPRRALDVMRTASGEFTELSGLRPERVIRCERADGGTGWVLEAEVTELTRVPDTMSLIAVYELAADRDGHVTGFRRVSRRERGRADGR
ncbi:gas vesicle protein GvpO [Streptomyces sp. 6N223]|uniref:gas vesicle protein GvpO n=1 Tax=Streptomyces sp. 6N223 TaxID=3457412 RepID=UPI003FD1B0F9